MYRSELLRLIPSSARLAGWLWAPVVALLAAVYLTTQVSLREFLPGELSVLLVQPVLWLTVATISGILWRYGLSWRPRPSPEILVRALSLGVFQIGAWLLAGLAFGFGQSPHGQELSVVAGNLLFVGTMLVGTELARAAIVGSVAEKSPSLAIGVGAGALTLFSIPVGKFGTVQDLPAGMQFVGETLFPTFAQSLLASVLVLGAGPLSSMLYRGLLLSFEWFFPILPDLHWMAAAFVGTMPAALGLLAVEGHFAGEHAKPHKGQRSDARIPGPWLATAALLATLVFFNAGGFGVRPTLIVGPSMQPSFGTGDIVITAPVAAEAIQVGDVIRFRTESGAVVHRVIEIRSDEIGLQFITRGDGNNVDDPLVLPEQLEGRMVLLLPKVGWPAIWIRQALQLGR